MCVADVFQEFWDKVENSLDLHPGGAEWVTVQEDAVLSRECEGVKTGKVGEEMAQIIIQYLGPEESITVINKAMDQISRRDAAVQALLRPFGEKLKNKRQKIKKGQFFLKKKRCQTSNSLIYFMVKILSLRKDNMIFHIYFITIILKRLNLFVFNFLKHLFTREEEQTCNWLRVSEQEARTCCR